jgi:serine/threonine-protein kinase RsbW
MNNHFELRIKGTLENLSQIGDFIYDALNSFGLDVRKIFDVQLAVDELCTNIISYGYTTEAGMIDISCSMDDNEIVVIIKDKGKPFNPMSVEPPDLDASLEERKIGGLGIYLARSLMDEVEYEFIDGMNVLSMLMRPQ